MEQVMVNALRFFGNLLKSKDFQAIGYSLIGYMTGHPHPWQAEKITTYLLGFCVLVQSLNTNINTLQSDTLPDLYLINTSIEVDGMATGAIGQEPLFLYGQEGVRFLLHFFSDVLPIEYHSLTESLNNLPISD